LVEGLAEFKIEVLELLADHSLDFTAPDCPMFALDASPTITPAEIRRLVEEEGVRCR
jgi:hypothetical protein